MPIENVCTTCLTCNGSGCIDGDLCSNCFGGGTIPVRGIFHMSAKMTSAYMEDALNKLNDIKEKVDEIKEVVDEL